MHNLLVYIGVALATMAVSVSAESDIKSVPEAEVPKRAHRKPQVIFEDDFNCNKLNTTLWGYDLGDGCDRGICGWGNQEKQIYDDKSAVSGYQGKYLRITAKRTNATHWTSSKILTRGKFTFTYGRVDVRVRFPLQDGAFPAIWMMPQDDKYGTWPKSGEIDIAEYQSAWRKNFAPDVPRTPGSLHFAKFNGGTAKSFWTKDNDPSQWHTYTMIWKEDGAEFLFDGKSYGSYSPPTTKDPEEWPFNQPFYLIMNLAVGPGFGTQPANDTNTMHMDVDWIRVTKL